MILIYDRLFLDIDQMTLRVRTLSEIHPSLKQVLRHIVHERRTPN